MSEQRVMMRDQFRAIVNDLQESLERVGRGDHLAPGLPAAHVREALSCLPLSPAVLDVMVAWFRWRNGVQPRYTSAPLGALWIVEIFYPLALGVAVAEREQNIQISATNPPAENFSPLVWQCEWLPLMADGAGGYLTVDLWGAECGYVRYASFTDAEDFIVAASWPDFLATVVAAYRNGILAVDGEGYLTTDIDEWNALLKQMNHVCAWGDEASR